MTRTRIAMWSGPRNISTAMMRAFENRPDTEVWDEPFYGHYLEKTGITHPGAAEIIASQGVDWREIAKRCTGDGPNNAAIFYQKHMTMHLLPGMDHAWLMNLSNCFLIREPGQVVASYGAVRPDLNLEDVGFIQQTALFETLVNSTGKTPLVIDSRDFLSDPPAMLEAMCKRLGIAYFTEMLHWPAGRRESDGVWGKYWYDAVWKSTGFKQYEEKQLKLTPRLQRIAEAARPYYQAMYKHRLLA